MKAKDVREWIEAFAIDMGEEGWDIGSKGLDEASEAIAKECESELADAKMTIGVLKAAIKVRGDLEEGLTAKLVVHEATKQRWEKANKVLRGQVNEYDDARLEAEMKLDKAQARVAVMAEAIEAVGLCRGGPPGGLQWMECRWCGRISVGSVTKHYEGCQRQKALSAAPKVVWSGEGKFERDNELGVSWVDFDGPIEGGLQLVTIIDEAKRQQVTVLVLADDTPQEGEE